MSLPQALAVSNTVGGLGAILDAGPNQNGARTFSLTSPASPPNTGDTVQILGSNDGFANDAFVIGNVATTDPTTPGQNAALTSALTARYLRTYRIAIGNPASPNVNCEAAESSPSAGGGGGGGSQGPLTSMNPFVQANLATGGNIGGAGATAPLTVDNFTSFDVAQTTAGQALTFVTPTSTTVDKVEFVSNDGSTSFTMYGQTIQPGLFGIVKYNSQSTGYTRPGYPSIGGDLLGAAFGIGTLDAHAFSLAANAKTWATSDGTTTTLGVASGTVAASALALQAGTGGISALIAATGQIHIGGAGVAFLNTPDSVQIQPTNNGAVNITATGTGTIAITAGAALTIDAGAQLTIGATNATSYVIGSLAGAQSGVILWGTGGLGLGVAAPGASGLAIGVPAAAPITIGATNATSVTIGNATAATRINTTGLGFNGAAGATALIDASASTTQGVRFPNMTTAQKNAIANTAGLVVFDTTLGKLCVNTGVGWQTITSA